MDRTTPEALPYLRFGELELDLEGHRGRRKGVPFYLAGNYWEVLKLLVERNGDPVTNQELCSVLGYVAVGTVTKVIERLRGAVGDVDKPYRYIGNQPGEGYRWLPKADALPPEVALKKDHKMIAITGYIWPALGSEHPTEIGTIPMTAPEPQLVRWGPLDDEPPGIKIISANAPFVPFEMALKNEVERKLLPQLGRLIPAGCTVVLADFHERENWRVFITSPEGQCLGRVWFGPDPQKAWFADGLVRVGDAPTDYIGIVWQIFQRYSDGSYRLIEAKY
jgi:hypothetical protein